ncbi:spore germination protein [Paenibacillus sp.]|uniref:spore germination protein n=1 Tax=Paenibacillus sp. TaxID=58172 RepID=UPI0028118ED2|nr:spore germination protein [Paenibacillus sp.]
MLQEVDRRSAESLQAMDDVTLTAELDGNLALAKEALGDSADVMVRRFRIGALSRTAALIFIDGMADATTIDRYVLEPVMRAESTEAEDPVAWLQAAGLPVNEVAAVDRLGKALHAVLSGDAALFVEGVSTALLLNTKGFEKRSIEEPRSEAVVRGPRNGFAETIRMNTAQIRLKLKDPNLRIKGLKVGQRGNTSVAVTYIEGVADPHIVDEVVRRIEKIDIDAVLDSGYIEQFIEDTHWTPFPLIQNTERPDKVVANLLEGKVAILCDGSPFVLIAPAVFNQFYHSPEDYYERYLIATLIRIIRIISMGMAVLLPSLYIAFSSFHPEMIPSRLVIAMAAGRSTVPFPSIVEAFLMEITMEILREASVRLPGPIGPTIGIVGALVVGQAAVEAGIVSPIMVIVVALTTIGSFASPSYSAAIALRMLRFPMMAAAALFGLYGIMLFLILIVIHLCSLKSFGVPYMAPLTPFRKKDVKDSFYRAPLYRMKERPTFFIPGDATRMGEHSKGDDS